MIGLTYLVYLICFISETVMKYWYANEIANTSLNICYAIIISTFMLVKPQILNRKKYILILLVTIPVWLVCLSFFSPDNPNNPIRGITTIVMFVLGILFVTKYQKQNKNNSIFKTFIFWSYSPYLLSNLLEPLVFDVSIKYSYNAGMLLANLTQAWISIIIIGLFMAEKEEIYDANN
jgi:hypothetical protein